MVAIPGIGIEDEVACSLGGINEVSNDLDIPPGVRSPNGGNVNLPSDQLFDKLPWSKGCPGGGGRDRERLVGLQSMEIRDRERLIALQSMALSLSWRVNKIKTSEVKRHTLPRRLGSSLQNQRPERELQFCQDAYPAFPALI